MASKHILTNYDFEGNEIQYVSLQKMASDPSGAELKDGLIWFNTSQKVVKYNNNGIIQELLYGNGAVNGQILYGGINANENLTLSSTKNNTKGNIIISDFTIGGFVKNSSTGIITGGNILIDSDIPSHTSTNETYGSATTNLYGHVKISDGIAVSAGVISLDVGTGLTLSGTSPNKKIVIDSTVITTTGTQNLTNKTLVSPILTDYTNAGHTHQTTATGGTLDHGLALTGLLDDDHTQYLLLAGRANGQVIYGGINEGDNITFRSTFNATKGFYKFPELAGGKLVKTDASSNLTTGTIDHTNLTAGFLSTDNNLGGSSTSDIIISSQKAIKTYVDNAIAGLNWKVSALVATTANITLSGLQTIDGVALQLEDRVLVKNQTNKAQNGVYNVKAGAWSRVVDMNANIEFKSASLFVEKGTANQNTGWVCVTDDIIEWTTNIDFVQFAGNATYNGGNGITITGNSIAIDNTVTTLIGTQTLTNKTLTNPTIGSFVNSNHNHTNSAGGGQLTDASLSSAIGTAKGGTNLTSYVLGDMLYSSASNVLAKLAGNTTTTEMFLTQTGDGTISSAPVWKKRTFNTALGDNTNVDYVITHNLGTKNVTLSVWRNVAPFDEIDYYAEKTSTNTITLRFNRIVTTNEFNVTILS